MKETLERALSQILENVPEELKMDHLTHLSNTIDWKTYAAQTKPSGKDGKPISQFCILGAMKDVPDAPEDVPKGFLQPRLEDAEHVTAFGLHGVDPATGQEYISPGEFYVSECSKIYKEILRDLGAPKCATKDLPGASNWIAIVGDKSNVNYSELAGYSTESSSSRSVSPDPSATPATQPAAPAKQKVCTRALLDKAREHTKQLARSLREPENPEARAAYEATCRMVFGLSPLGRGVRCDGSGTVARLPVLPKPRTDGNQ
ncbi:hypothetical protein FN846DRAFT_970853 [Sphaerosporella brunnea]|uniref:Uncharacterized protein n=1 Tax=Sphaerosporella brunnea TaxID=1250544 RepID=A0A5J5EIT4_9PEZI|nr:hypothetical protein FN846DRAFT_970853 [Sphaerosporella brunnea]